MRRSFELVVPGETPILAMPIAIAAWPHAGRGSTAVREEQFTAHDMELLAVTGPRVEFPRR